MMQVVTETNPDTLGARIGYARERAGLSTAQLARRLGVKSRTLANWERDETEPDELLIYIDHAAEFSVWIHEIVGLLESKS